MSQPGTPHDAVSVSSSAAFTEPRREARRAARRAAEASAAAAALHADTTKVLAAHALQDLKLPCVPVSPLTVKAESLRTISADHVQPSPWCALPHTTSYTFSNAADRAQLDGVLAAGLKELSAGGRPLTFNDAALIGEVVAGSATLERLDLSGGALDPARAPPLPADLVQAEADQLETQVGPEDDEASIEKLQAMCEKAKIEFSGYEASINALASRKFERMTPLLAGLVRCYSVTHLNVSRNGLGAPNADGRAQYQALRRLGVLVDETKVLRSVDFSGNGMGPVGVGIVAKALTKNITIQSINLSGNELMGDAPDEEDDPENEEGDPVFGELNQGLEALSEVLKKNKFLKALALRNNRLKTDIEVDGEDDGADTPLGKFLEPLKKYHRLEVLDLASNELGAAGARMVTAALLSNKSVTTLDVSDNGLGLAGLDFISKLISENTTLTTLHFQRNKITWNKKSKKATKAAFEVFGRFASALSQNGTLTDLNMAGHHFGVDVAEALFTGFEKSRVTVLNVDSNNLCGEPDVAVPDTRALELILAATKRAERPLRVLRLASNRLLAGGAALVADNLLDLDEIDLRRNVIGDAGCRALCDALQRPAADGRKPSLRILRLGYNAIADATPLAELLQRLPGLRELELGHNRIGSDAEAFTKLIDAAGRGTLLRDLVLEANALGTAPEHIAALKDLFARAQAPLSRVDLYDNPAISVDDSLALIGALKHNNALRVIRISSQAGDRYQLAEAVAKTLETNKALVDVDLCFPLDLECPDLVASISERLVVNALTGVQDGA